MDKMMRAQESRKGAGMSRWIDVLAAALLAVAALTTFAFAGPKSSAATYVDADSPMTRRVSMGEGKSIIVDLPRDAAEIVVGNPKVANAVVRSARKLYVMALMAGQTTIFAVDREGRQIANLELSVGRDVGELSPLLKAALPRSNITAHTVNDSIILTGTVSSPGEALRAVDIAKGFAARAVNSAGGTREQGAVVNALTVSGEDQVMLKVTVAEVERRVLKQLGFSTQANGEKLLEGGWGVFSQENPFGINPTLSAGKLSLTMPSGSSTLKAYERYGVSRVLAEPTVTAVSGQNAKLVVGGEIPVPGNASLVTTGNVLTTTPAITFKSYGVTLSFIPVVLSEGRIQLRLSTEVTEVDPQNSYSYNNVAVPGFKTRKNETTIELPSGGSIATAGLLTEKSAQAINGLPGLINLPVLGALFRSRDYLRQETELLIVVTPYIAKGLASREVVRPDDGFVDASDPQAWLLGRVNRLYSSPSNPPVQSLKGRIGFIHD